MKKTLFALFAVLPAILTVVLMAACGELRDPLDANEALPYFTEDGRPMAHLT